MQTAGQKTCVKCKQKDVTDFTTCRFCGTRYGAILPRSSGIKGPGLGDRLRSWPSLIIILLVLMILKGPFSRLVVYVVTGGHTLKEVIRQETDPARKTHQ